jgi:hypothetical protein
MKLNIVLESSTYICTNTFGTRGRSGSGVYKAVGRDKDVVLKVTKRTASILNNGYLLADDLTPIHEGPLHDTVGVWCAVTAT